MGTTLDLRVCVATLSLYQPFIDRSAVLCEAAYDRSWIASLNCMLGCPVLHFQAHSHVR